MPNCFLVSHWAKSCSSLAEVSAPLAAAALRRCLTFHAPPQWLSSHSLAPVHQGSIFKVQFPLLESAFFSSETHGFPFCWGSSSRFTEFLHMGIVGLTSATEGMPIRVVMRLRFLNAYCTASFAMLLPCSLHAFAACAQIVCTSTTMEMKSGYDFLYRSSYAKHSVWILSPCTMSCGCLQDGMYKRLTCKQPWSLEEQDANVGFLFRWEGRETMERRWSIPRPWISSMVKA